jgi:DNA-binding NtrC family response regulator
MAIIGPSYQSNSRGKLFPLLVVEDNKDHQLLISYSLKAKMPLSQPVFTESTEEALDHLQLTAAATDDFPKLVLLDLCIPIAAKGWQLLKAMRKRYPRLPVIVLSSHHDSDIVEKAYELGAHSFISKPLNLDEWEHYFKVLNDYWLGTVTLPSSQ